MSCNRPVPCNEEDLAFLAILISCEIKIIDGITTLINWQTGLKIVIAFRRFPYFVDDNLLMLNFECNESVDPPCFKLLEPQFAVIMHSHSRRCICLPHSVCHQMIQSFVVPHFFHYNSRILFILCHRSQHAKNYVVLS